MREALDREVGVGDRHVPRPFAGAFGRVVLVVALTTPYVETGARPGEAYGYGVWMMRRGDVWVYQHSGLVPDFSAFVAWVPARRVGVAAMMNATNALVRRCAALLKA